MTGPAQRLLATGDVFRFAARTGVADFRAMYTLRTWVLGWLLRVLSQVAFFAFVGRLLGSEADVRFLLIGNAVMIAAMEACLAVAGTTMERWSGTLPLLIASPVRPIVVFAGRTSYLVVTATFSSAAALFLVAPLFGVELPWPAALAVLPLLVSVAFTTYLLALFVAGFTLRAMGLAALVGNVLYLTQLAVSGAQVPVSYWPAWVQWLAWLFPVTHGLAAVRAVLGGAPTGSVWPQVALEFAVGLGWLAAAVLAFEWLAGQGRRAGTLEFGD